MPKRSEPKPDSPTVRLTVIPKQCPAEDSHDLNRQALNPDSPSVRLALGADLITSVGPKALGPQGPTVRLAQNAKGQPEGSAGFERLASAYAPAVRLAHVPGAQGDNVLLGQRGVAQLPEDSRPALLVSYWYLEPFLANRHRYAYRDWVLDSGAFSAHNSGAEINLDEFVDKALELIATDPTLTEVFALDVISDHKASLRNCEYMWKKGVPAIPTFHFGEPWEVLLSIARDYPKIALGGLVGQKVEPRDKWIGQCFARVWPKRIHGFGLSGEKTIMRFPFHSVDATNWELAPCKFGHWRAFGGQRVSVRGSKQNLRAEVEWYLALERRARVRWRKQMEQLAALPGEVPTTSLPGKGPRPKKG